MQNFLKSALLVTLISTATILHPLPATSFSISDLDNSNAELLQTAMRLASLRGAESLVRESGSSSVSQSLSLSGASRASIIPQDASINLYVVSSVGEVNRYDSASGAFLSTFAITSFSAVDLAFGGPNGNLFVTDPSGVNAVLQFAKETGAYLGPFTPPGPSSTLVDPLGLTFGPNGNLFVANGGTSTGPGNIEQYDGNTGALVNVFASRGQTSFAPGELIFQNGFLFVADGATDSILRFNQDTGAFIDTFASGGGLSGPSDFVFGPGPNGNLFVTSAVNNTIIQYDGLTGALIGTFASGNGLNVPAGITFGPDNNLYVSNINSNSVARFDGATGSYLGDFVIPGSGGLNSPIGLEFAPAPIPEPAIGSIFSMLGALGLSLTWSRVKGTKKRSSP